MLTKKIGNITYTWINDYAKRLEAQREARRWLRDGFSAKIIKRKLKKTLFPYSLYVAQGIKKGGK